MEGWVSIDTHPMPSTYKGDSIIGGNLDVNAELYVVGNVLISNDMNGARLHLGNDQSRYNEESSKSTAPTAVTTSRSSTGSVAQVPVTTGGAESLLM
jgi:hypothetical protein